MDDYTRKFSIVDDKDVEIYNILTTVYQALEEKGYPQSLLEDIFWKNWRRIL